jgi:hypothetical protein
MIYTICAIGVFCIVTAAQFVLHSQISKFKVKAITFEAKAEQLEQMIIKNAEYTAELSERLDAAEDYMKMIRSETENDKHADYWASVMNYNPYIEKEGEK